MKRARSAKVKTRGDTRHRTAARVVSIRVIRACACGDRRRGGVHHDGSLMSSTVARLAAQVARISTRRTAAPKYFAPILCSASQIRLLHVRVVEQVARRAVERDASRLIT